MKILDKNTVFKMKNTLDILKANCALKKKWLLKWRHSMETIQDGAQGEKCF